MVPRVLSDICYKLHLASTTFIFNSLLLCQGAKYKCKLSSTMSPVLPSGFTEVTLIIVDTNDI